MFARPIPLLTMRIGSFVALLAIFGLSLEYEFGGLSRPTRVVSVAKAKVFKIQDRTGIELALKNSEEQLPNLHISFLGFDQKQDVENWLIIASQLIRSPPFAALT
jgi:hypothetical protein